MIWWLVLLVWLIQQAYVVLLVMQFYFTIDGYGYKASIINLSLSLPIIAKIMLAYKALAY